MTSGALEPLLGRTLVLVAHPDDECIACGGLLQRMASPRVIYATDGSPEDPYFWGKYGDRAVYSKLRQEEARKALAKVGVRDVGLLAEQYPALVDQQLFRNLPIAYGAVAEQVSKFRPTVILTLAYEGGHPDHDSCNFLAAQIHAATGIPVWEAPLYRRTRSELSLQEFVQANGTEIYFEPSPEELVRKRAMCLEYSSQGDFLSVFKLEREVFRPIAAYDYSRPPHRGELNYERWRWSMSGKDVAAAFAAFRRPEGHPSNQRSSSRV